MFEFNASASVRGSLSKYQIPLCSLVFSAPNTIVWIVVVDVLTSTWTGDAVQG